MTTFNAFVVQKRDHFQSSFSASDFDHVITLCEDMYIGDKSSDPLQSGGYNNASFDPEINKGRLMYW